MKPIVSGIALLFVVGALLGIAILTAAPATAALAPATTTTPTVTSTPVICDQGAPAKPKLKSPNKGEIIPGTRATLKWDSVPCADKYRVVLLRGSPNGSVISETKTKKTSIISPALTRDTTYYWYVKACDGKDCQQSKTWRFKVAPSNGPPPPTAGPTVTGTPPSTGGNPPSQIADYKGEGVYLNTDPNLLYRFDCALDEFKWVDFGQGQNVYNIALWYTPNESVRYQRLLLDTGQIVETANLSANADGYVSFTAVTNNWTPDVHYHLIFTGQSGGQVHCGHFDLLSPNGSPGAEVPHAASDVERAYRTAGLEPPR